MILILLGTFDIGFARPLHEIEKLCHDDFLKEEIIVQNGFTKFTSAYFTFRPFIPQDELDGLYLSARLIITHAGTGSILKGVKLGKKVIAIARLQKYAECVDDHQLELLSQFTAMGYVYPWNECDSLKQILLEVEKFEPQKYVSLKRNIIDYLDDYISRL